MATLTINGTTFNELTSGFSTGALVAGRYFDDANIFSAYPHAEEDTYDDSIRSFVGVDGVNKVRFGYRGTLIQATVVMAGLSNVSSGFYSTISAFQGLTTYSIALPNGPTFINCCYVGKGPTNFIGYFGGVPISYSTLTFMQMAKASSGS